MDKSWHKKYKAEIKKYNQDHYQTEIEALKKIIGTPLSDKFTMDMYIALVNGRKITPKMLQAIRKIILRNSPEFRTKVTIEAKRLIPVSYTHLRAHETSAHLVCRLLLEKKK